MAAAASSQLTDDHVSKTRTLPPDYRRWRLWEVGAPLGIPVLVFIWLFIDFAMEPAKHSSDALIALSGAGDFLIFGALLVLNVYGTIDLEVNALSQDGENFEKNIILVVAGILLFFYAAVRISVHTLINFSTKNVQFGIAVVSTIVLLVVLLWIDKIICDLHLAKLRVLVRRRQLLAQYNVS